METILPPENALYLIAINKKFSNEIKQLMQSYQSLDNNYRHKLVNFQDGQKFSVFQWIVFANHYPLINCFIDNFAEDIQFGGQLYQRGDPISPWSVALAHCSKILLNRLMTEKITINPNELDNVLFELVRSQEELSSYTMDYLIKNQIINNEKIRKVVINSLSYEKLELFKHLILTNKHLINDMYALKIPPSEKIFNNILDIVSSTSLNIQSQIREEAIKVIVLNTEISIKSIYQVLKNSNTELNAKTFLKELYDLILEKNNLSKKILMKENKKSLKL